MNGQQTFLTIDSSIENVARNCAKQLITNRQDVVPERDNDYRTVNINSLSIYNPRRSIGCERETHRWLQDESGIGELLGSE